MRGSISIFFYQVKQYHLYRQKKNMKITQAKKLTKINTKSKNIILFSFHRGDTKITQGSKTNINTNRDLKRQ